MIMLIMLANVIWYILQWPSKFYVMFEYKVHLTLEMMIIDFDSKLKTWHF
jgi:hypothetical protein